jgi:hypothetical protein
MTHSDENIPRAVCATSGLPLWAQLDVSGAVIGICNRANEIERGGDLSEGRYLPLYGNEPKYDHVTEVLSAPAYQVTNRVTRSYTVRDKTARELLEEISWWFAATHSVKRAA